MDDYELLEELGRGGMGVVYRARHRTLDREVAIKRIRGGQMSDMARVVERFRREVDLHKRLSHPAIVKVLDGGTAEGAPYLVMELLRARTLATVLDEQPCPAARVLPIVDQVLEALDYLHRERLVHRDVKCGNIMVEDGGRAVLMDLGLARQEGGLVLSVSGEVVGTPRYLAPELIAFDPATPQTDLWALGVVTYVALTGRAPFESRTLQGLIASIVREPAPPLGLAPGPGVAALERWVLRFLEKEPSRRWPDAAAAREALAAVTAALAQIEPVDTAPRPQPPLPPKATQPPPAPTPPPLPPAPPARPAPRVAPLAAGALGVALVLAALGLQLRKPGPTGTPPYDATPSAASPQLDVADAVRTLARVARRALPEPLDRPWIAVRDAVTRAAPGSDVFDARDVIAKHPQLAAPFARLSEDLTHGALAPHWAAVRPHVAMLLSSPDTPADLQEALLEALDRLDTADALAAMLGVPAPFGVQAALAPAVQLARSEQPPGDQARDIFPAPGQLSATLYLPSELPGSLGSEVMNLTDEHVFKAIDERERTATDLVRLTLVPANAWRLWLLVRGMGVQTYARFSPPHRTGWLPVRFPDGATVPRDRSLWLCVTLRGALATGGEWRVTQGRAFQADPVRPGFALDRVAAERLP